MQKIINGIALFSGVVSLGIVVGGVWVYLEKDNLVNGVKTQMINGVTESIQKMLPGMLDAAMPEIPEVPSSTGGVVPF
jgi:hypothetical protein|tara:strand:- start:179 stop:412 length:234 start_codon:yes stop_codon:yes gene_type:complete